jgi:hypothetical protein
MPSSDFGGAPGPVRRRQDVASGIALTPLYRRLSELGAWSRLDTVVRMGPRGRSGEFTTQDPDGLLRDLMATGRFWTRKPGGFFILEQSRSGSVPARKPARGSLWAGSTCTIHLDRRSPLAIRSNLAGPRRYSLPLVAAHVAGRLGAKLTRRIMGGWKRLDIECALARQQRFAADGDQGRAAGDTSDRT